MKKINILLIVLFLALAVLAVFLFPWLELFLKRQFIAAPLLVVKILFYAAIGFVLSLPQAFGVEKARANWIAIFIEVLLLAGIALFFMLGYPMELLSLFSVFFGYLIHRCYQKETATL